MKQYVKERKKHLRFMKFSGMVQVFLRVDRIS